MLPKAINSVLNQTKSSIQISVFDDKSTDNTYELINSYPQVNWIFSETEKGYVYGRNKLMMETDALYYCSLDDDSWFMGTDELDLAIKYLEENPRAAAIAFDILSPDKPESKLRTNPVETNTFIGCGHVLRLSAVNEAGYYTKFPAFYGGEEKDLSLRLIDLGYSIVKLPGVHVWHEKTIMGRDIKMQMVSNVCNDLTFAYLRTPLPLLILILPYKIILHLKNGIRSKLNYTISGTLIFFKSLPSMKRNPVKYSSLKKFRKLSHHVS